MKCPLCGKGVMKKQRVPVDKYGVFVGEFLAEVCSACGEQIFDSRESSLIERRIKQLGLWGLPVESRVYRVGGNFVVSLKKKVAEALGINKPTAVVLIPQVKQNRLVVEIPQPAP